MVLISRHVCCCTGDLKKEYQDIKFLSSISEISLFSELLSVLIVIFWAASSFLFESVGALQQSMSSIDHWKLLASYICLFLFSIPSDKIVRRIREKRIMRLEKKIRRLKKHHPEQQFDIEFIDRNAYMNHNLVPWDHAVCFM